MAKYDYVKVRVDDSERQRLESMVATGEASSMAAAIRKLAFDQRGREDVAALLSEVSEAHLCLCELVRAVIQNKVLYEAEIYEMERKVAKLSQSVAKLSKALRR